MEQLSSLIYKYFNWNDFESRKVLTDRELYFCNAKRWKNYGEYDFIFKPIDKQAAFDRIEQAVYKMRNEDFPLFEKWFNIHIHKCKIDVGNYSSLTWFEKDLWEARIVDEIIKYRVNDIVTNRPNYENFIKNYYFNRTGIYSTSLTKNSKELWEWKSSYRQQLNGNAVCVGLDLEKLKKQLDVIGNYSIGIINYGEELNEVEFIGSGNDFLVHQLNSIIFTLKKDAVDNLSDQQELRVMKFLTKDISKNSPERFMNIDKDVLTEILISANATKEAQEEIISVGRGIGIESKIFSW